MRVIICYHSKGMSNSIVASTISNVDKIGLKGIDIERLNIDKLNVMKYLKKAKENNNLPKVMYIYSGNNDLKEKIEKKYSEIHIEEYSREMMYKPERVPGNKLKTRVYLLIDKIKYDYVSNYEYTEVYKLDLNNKNIIKESKSYYEIYHPRKQSQEVFLKREDALIRLESYLEFKENMCRKEIEDLEIKLKVTKKELKEKEQENRNILERLRLQE